MLIALLVVNVAVLLMGLALLGMLIYYRHSPKQAPSPLDALTNATHLPVCDFGACGTLLASSAIRTHHGHYRCATHKNA